MENHLILHSGWSGTAAAARETKGEIVPDLHQTVEHCASVHSPVLWNQGSGSEAVWTAEVLKLL